MSIHIQPTSTSTLVARRASDCFLADYFCLRFATLPLSFATKIAFLVLTHKLAFSSSSTPSFYPSLRIYTTYLALYPHLSPQPIRHQDVRRPSLWKLLQLWPACVRCGVVVRTVATIDRPSFGRSSVTCYRVVLCCAVLCRVLLWMSCALCLGGKIMAELERLLCHPMMCSVYGVCGERARRRGASY